MGGGSFSSSASSASGGGAASGGACTESLGSAPPSAFHSAPPALSYQRANPQQFPNPLRTWSTKLPQGRETPSPKRLFLVFSSFLTQSSAVLPSVLRS